MFTNNPRIVTDNLVGCWDPVQSQFPPRGIATTWADYSGRQAYYNVIGVDGVYLKNTSTNWVGYFPATIPSTGLYTVMFDYVTDVANTDGLVLDNDGVSDNLYNASIDTTTSVQHFQKTVNVTVAGAIKFFCRRNAGGNITITNFRYFKTGPLLYDCAGGSDGSGSGNNGFMHNGTCFDFDGTDDLVLTNDPVITGTGDFTFTAWINCATFTSSNFICGNYGAGNTGGVEFYTLHNNKLYLHIAGSVISDTLLVADTWYHVAATRTSGLCQLYIDGVADGAAVTRASSITGSINFAIGNGPNYTSENMDGKIADVKVFNVALSAANMKELYDDSKVIIPTKNAAAGGFVSQTNLIGWWPLAEGAGDICYDGSGNGYHGIVSNEDGDEWLTGQTGCPQLVEGYNRPMFFDGSNDVVENTSVSFPTGTQSRTIAGWVWLDDATSSGGVFGYGTGPSTPYQVFEFYNYGTSIRLHYATYDSGGSTALSSKTWYHLAGTYDGTTAKVYINGALNHTDTVTLATVSSFARFGCHNYSASPGGFVKGNINEVVFYNTALSLAQVQALAATGPNGGPLPPDPMSLSNSSDINGYWRNDGSVNYGWADLSGNNNTGTVYGSPSSVLFKQGYNGSKSTSTGRDGQGFPLRFKNNGAVGFNGSNNYVGLGSDVTFKASGGWTVESWVMPDAASAGPYNIIGSTAYDYNSWFWSLFSNKLAMWDLAPGGVWKYGNTSLLVGQWYHTVLVSDPDNISYYIYLNGEDDMSTAWAAYNGSWQPSKAGLKVRYFGRGNTSSGRYWNGQLSGAKFYDRALTQAEITQNFNAQRSRFGV